MELFQAGAHWTCREETAEACARRAEVFFQRLGQCDPAYARWFEYVYSRRNALQLPFEPTYDTFLRFFGRKKYRLGKDGFIFDAWTGQEQRGRGGLLNFTCGSGLPFYLNGCLLYLPREEPAATRVLTVSVLTEVVRAMVLAWEPDSCAVISEKDVASKKALETGEGCIGWLTYIANHRGRVPPLPKPVRVEPMEDKGTLIILTPERFSVRNPAHVSLAERVRERLESAEMLTRRAG
ncbi:immunity 52 family protein [Vitiosangium sp. GDMCC 1.1324]|uniref:immunity 52 family protein n=1 Tax=Vitiosangium sp. (strain GDMCC 1.1324) TaxID=2138576 RepID=UPI00130E0A9E|nr:immunity 52 family protein [Vitiosangium sp. GDMCC 1.1324]